jgi:hypothetical protein
VSASFAGNGDKKAKSVPKTGTPTGTISNNTGNDAGKGAAKVCACQLLSVASSNEQFAYVAVFAEKTNYGNLDNSFSIAMSVLEKEKKQMKEQFYSKVKLVKKFTAYSSCKTLLGQLQVGNDELRVYDILDADILGNKNIQSN